MPIRVTRKEDKDWFRNHPRSEWRIREPVDAELEELQDVGEFALEMLEALRQERPELPIQMAVFKAGDDIFTTMPVKTIDGHVRIYNPVSIKLEILPGIEHALREFKKLTGKSAATLIGKLEKAMGTQVPGGTCSSCKKDLATGALLIKAWQLNTDTKYDMCRICFYDTSPQTHCVEKMSMVVKPGEVAATTDIVSAAAHMDTVAAQVLAYKTAHALLATLWDINSLFGVMAKRLVDPTFSLFRCMRELYEYFRPELQRAGLKQRNLADVKIVSDWIDKTTVSSATRYIWYLSLFDEFCRVKGGVTAEYASLARFRDAYIGMAEFVPTEVLDATEFTRMVFLTRLHQQHGDKVYLFTVPALEKLTVDAPLTTTNNQLLLPAQVFTILIPDELALNHDTEKIKHVSIAELDAVGSFEERYWAITLSVVTNEGLPKHINWLVPLPTANLEGEDIQTEKYLTEWITQSFPPETHAAVIASISKILNLIIFINTNGILGDVYNTHAATEMLEKLATAKTPKQQELYRRQLQGLEPRIQKIILV